MTDFILIPRIGNLCSVCACVQTSQRSALLTKGLHIYSFFFAVNSNATKNAWEHASRRDAHQTTTYAGIVGKSSVYVQSSVRKGYSVQCGKLDVESMRLADEG